MCGIVGLVGDRGVGPARPSEAAVLAGLDAVQHRGPDDSRCDRVGSATFGTARLAMVDRPTSAQPMRDAAGRHLLAFNGEIYNFRELRTELEREGRRFATDGDTEVLLHALIHWGVAALSRLKGQFAFALWDDVTSELLLARDRFGIVPLHWTHTAGGGVAFASEVKSLRAMGLHPRLSLSDVIDVGVLWGTHPGRSVYAGVETVRPGGYVRIGAAGVERTSYWQFRYAAERDPAPFADQAARLRDLLGRAVERRVPVYGDPAVLLSGGLDSSAVLALLRGAHPTGRITSYSIQFAQAALDEEPFQALAATEFDTDHMAILCGDRSVAATLVEAVQHAEQPLTRTASASSIALAATIEAHGTRAVLSGEGADELFCGYDLFKIAAIRDAWSRDPDSDTLPAALTDVLAQQSHLGRAVERAFYEQGIDRRDDPLFSHLNRWSSSFRITQYLAAEHRAGLTVDTVLARVRDGLPAAYLGWSAVEQAQYLEVTYFLASSLLASQCDRPYMAHSIEARYPFLDEDVVDFALTLPLESKLAGLQEKAVLKRAVGDDVPAAIRDRVKQPYTAPEGDVFRSVPGAELIDAVLAPAALREHGVFDPKRVAWLVNKLRQGRTSFHDDLALLWIVSVEILADTYGVA
ncbi:asparagine synthase (glutamine-hydrolyzing) [Propionicicella superfundia]|uniref:asparagine synthase (glutamine-hydrolyzing) n=1 Tax=Propionicicella superfundia TaxID=348582 RepID=UPI000420602F|nr:asparagine synthase (glutamine-hydrolyzing) [Propionicicella superfundia]